MMIMFMFVLSFSVPPVMEAQEIPQQPGVTQGLLIASTQQYPQMSPPAYRAAYMPSTQPIGSTTSQAYMVTNDQQMPPIPVFVPLNLASSSGNSTAQLANENTQQVAAEMGAGSKSPALASATAEQV